MSELEQCRCGGSIDTDIYPDICTDCDTPELAEFTGGNPLDVLRYAFCRKCNGHLHPDDLIQGMCLWCWANEPDAGGE